MINHDSSLLKKLVHTLAIFSQQLGWKESLKNLIEAQIKMMECCATSMRNLNDTVKELIREYRDDE
ncbi:hypothetical protein [Priestia megaterium]|uniref:hypothetical protein n=1 Tax=Priestia megaterium TaxID=1404 RepID=UPI001F132E77|nr:hypothetical protein [Priestia megaterium]UMZ36119.1 hypothetical protein MGJ28_28950 [Priestia megaterium]